MTRCQLHHNSRMQTVATALQKLQAHPEVYLCTKGIWYLFSAMISSLTSHTLMCGCPIPERSASECPMLALHPSSGQGYKILHIMCLKCIRVWQQAPFTSHSSGTRTEWLCSCLCVLSWIPMATADWILLPSSLSWNAVPKEHLIFMLHLHACMSSIGPSQGKVFMDLVWGCLWNWISGCLLKEGVPCHYQFKVLVFHISILHTNIWLCFFCFYLFIFLNECMDGHACTCDTCMWKLEDSLGESVPSVYHVGPIGLQARVFNQQITSLASPAVLILFFFLRKDLVYLRLVSNLLCSRWKSQTAPVLLYAQVLRPQVC